MMVVVTGAAGFIGSTLVLRLLARGDSVLGIHNHNHNEQEGGNRTIALAGR